MPGTAFDCIFPGSAKKVYRSALFLSEFPLSCLYVALTQILGDGTPCIGVIIPLLITVKLLWCSEF